MGAANQATATTPSAAPNSTPTLSVQVAEMAGVLWGMVEGREDVLLVLAHRLDASSLARLGMCSRSLRALAARDLIWKTFIPNFWHATKIRPIPYDNLNRSEPRCSCGSSFLLLSFRMDGTV
eukprot:766745-Hanusia_phi.AAC.5